MSVDIGELLEEAESEGDIDNGIVDVPHSDTVTEPVVEVDIVLETEFVSEAVRLALLDMEDDADAKEDVDSDALVDCEGEVDTLASPVATVAETVTDPHCVTCGDVDIKADDDDVELADTDIVKLGDPEIEVDCEEETDADKQNVIAEDAEYEFKADAERNPLKEREEEGVKENNREGEIEPDELTVDVDDDVFETFNVADLESLNV